MWQEILIAIGLVLVIEGLLPFAMPGLWRNAIKQILTMDDKGLRIMGLISMLMGVGLLYWVR